VRETCNRTDSGKLMDEMRDMNVFLALPFVRARKKKALEQEREIFQSMLEFKQSIEYLNSLITKSMASPEVFMKCRDTMRTMLMNTRKKWLQKIGNASVPAKRAEHRRMLLDLFESYIVMMSDFISEGFVNKEVSMDVLENHVSELVKSYVVVFDVGLPKPIPYPEASEEEQHLFLANKMTVDSIFSFKDSKRAVTYGLAGSLCKITAVSSDRNEDGYGSITFKCNGQTYFGHISDFSGLQVHDKVSIFW